MADLNQYVVAIQAAQALGEGVTAIVSAIMDHAHGTLTPDEFAALHNRWKADEADAHADAGVE